MKSKIQDEYVTEIFGFPVKILNCPMVEFEGQWLPKIDHERMGNLLFIELLKSKHRLTGHQVRFMREHLRLKQTDMKALCGWDQSNMSRTEANEDRAAFLSDANLMGFKIQMGRLFIKKLEQELEEEMKREVNSVDLTPASNELEDPEQLVTLRKSA
jgi:hypothetical protein